MPQGLLPFFPKGVSNINSNIAFENRDGTITYFNFSMPIFSHHVDDKAAFRVITSQLYVNGVAKQSEIQKAFGVTEISIKRSVKKYREGGIEGLYANRRSGTKPRVMTPEIVVKAQSLLDQGIEPSKIAVQLNIKANTLNKAMHSGKVKKKSYNKS